MTLVVRDPLSELSVSRETIVALESLQSLVEKWNPAINLVSRSTVPVFWKRHILDSAQLFHLAPEGARRWVDLGSGAGLPGLVVAIIARELRPTLSVVLIESDVRKVTFLREATRALGLTCTVVHGRIELSEPQQADVVSARALTSLSGLLSFADRHLIGAGVAIFPKGGRWQAEIEQARADWTFDYESIDSLSDDQAAILVIRNINRASHR